VRQPSHSLVFRVGHETDAVQPKMTEGVEDGELKVTAQHDQQGKRLQAGTVFVVLPVTRHTIHQVAEETNK
jgi:hypothetical protein